MWNKSESGLEPESASVQPTISSPTVTTASSAATIGPSISINGTLVGGEDLCVEGKLEGEISVEQHSVTVGRKGRVKADIYGKSICVEGEVKGNLFGKDQVVIRQSGKVIGNVTSPRVSLENGSHFRGSIDMQPVSGKLRKPERARDESSQERPQGGDSNKRPSNQKQSNQNQPKGRDARKVANS